MKRDLSKEIRQLKSRKEFDTFWNIPKRQSSIEHALYYFISLERKSWLVGLLRDCTKLKNLTHEMFILSVVEKYTLIKMGFMDEA